MIMQGCALSGASAPDGFYGYWQTFDLQRVFPSLQDKFSTFPRATIANRILVDWPTLRDGFTRLGKSTVERRLDSVYGAYLVALSKGAAPYQLADKKPKFATVSFIVQQTGVDRGTVVAFLSSLEKLAKGGGVDLKFWNPDRAVALNKEVTKRIKEDAATAPVAPLVSTINSAAGAVKWGGIGILALVALVAAKKFIP